MVEPKVNYSVLYVDDEKGFLELAKDFMERANKSLKVDTVSSAFKALEAIKHKEFDGIISDFLMPEMNGLEFLKTLRKEDISIPFIILTGKGNEDVAIEALNVGASRYIQKSSHLKNQFTIIADSIIQDITNWRIQNSVSDREKKFSSLFSNAPDLIFIVDPFTLKFLEVNDEVLLKLGYSEEDLEKITLRDLYDEQYDFTDEDNFVNMETSTCVYELEMIRKDGSTIPLEISARVVQYGEIAVLQAFGRDLSLRKVTEKKLEIKKKLEELILQLSVDFINLPLNEYDPVILQALESITKFLNTERSFIFEFSESEESFTETYQCTRQSTDTQIEALSDQLRDIPIKDAQWLFNELIMNQEVYLERIDDVPEGAVADRSFLEKLGIKSILIVPIYGINKISGAFGIGSTTDISKWSKDERSSMKLLAQIFSSAFQRKEALLRLVEKEEVYRSILDLSEEAFSISDTNFNVVYCNLKFASMLGYTPDEIIDLKIFDLIEKEAHQEIRKQAEKRNAGLEDEYEMVFMAKDGAKIKTRVFPKILAGMDGKRKGSYSRFKKIE
ncbi:MAG: PAS domain S-box protein [Candidatus Kariarchaeaceae archaeon]